MTAFPDDIGYTQADKLAINEDAISFANKQAEPDGSGVCFSFERWDKHYGFVHFDMRKMTPLSDGNSRSLKLNFEYATAEMTADYTIWVGIIYLSSIYLRKDPNGKTVIVRSF